MCDCGISWRFLLFGNMPCADLVYFVRECSSYDNFFFLFNDGEREDQIITKSGPSLAEQ